jgi:hypothetical protein
MTTSLSFTFPAPGGQGTIEGALHQPAEERPATPALIVCHGRWNTMDLPLLQDLCQRASQAGMRALRFNFPYVTQKTNPSPDGSAEIAALEGALAALRDQFRPSPGRTYLAGKSLGAIVAGHVAVAHQGLGGYIALGYPLHGPGGDQVQHVDHLARLGCPALFVIGERDPYCRPQRLRAVMQSIPSACTLEIVAGGDHSYRPPSAPDGSDEYLSQAVDAVTRWLAVQIGD